MVRTLGGKEIQEMRRLGLVYVLVSLVVSMGLASLAGAALAAVINGDDGDNRLTGTAKRDVIRGLAGDDEMSGRVGPDVLYGNSDTDFVSGDRGNDEVYGNRGDDNNAIVINEPGGLFGGQGNDAMYGRSGDDLLYDTEGENAFRGGRGNDSIVATDSSNDRDRIFCGSGRDEVFADRRDRVAEDCERVRLNAIP